MELEKSDLQVDYNDVTKDTYNDFVKHNAGIVCDTGFATTLTDNARVASAGAKVYANIDDTTQDYYVNIKYTSATDVKVTQKTATGETEVTTLPASDTANTIRFKLDSSYVDSLADKTNTNIALTLSAAASITDMWLETEAPYSTANVEKAPYVTVWGDKITPTTPGGTTPTKGNTTPGGGGTVTEPVTEPEVNKATLTPVVTPANNKATATMTEGDLTTAIAAAQENKTDIVIAPTVTGSAATQTVQIPTTKIAAAASAIKNNLVIKTADVTVTIPNSALAALGSQVGKTTAITVAANDDGSVKITVTVADKDVEVAGLTASIKANSATAGTVAVLVGADGKESIMKNSVVVDGNVVAKIAEGSTIKVIDNTKSFTDTDSHWGKDYIAFATARELFAGLTETTFGPDVKMTRGMFVTVLGRYVDAASGSADAGFADIASGEYYTDFVNWAAGNGIVSGVSAGQFAPNATITREQLCVMLANYVKYANISLAGSKDVNFSDGASISSWASDAVTTMAKAGIINGRNDGTFDPQGQASRAEVATILQNFITAIATK